MWVVPDPFSVVGVTHFGEVVSQVLRALSLDYLKNGNPDQLIVTSNVMMVVTALVNT